MFSYLSAKHRRRSIICKRSTIAVVIVGLGARSVALLASSPSSLVLVLGKTSIGMFTNPMDMHKSHYNLIIA